MYLGMYRVFEEEQGTRFVAVMQVNMFFSIKRLQDIMPQFLVKWAGKFRDLAMHRYQEFQPQQPSLE